MDRLTERNGDSVFILSKVTGWTRSSNWSKPAQEAIDRLAAYEDSGLTPEEVQKMALAQKEGRLVVLPCKVGTRVWVIGQDCDLCHDMYTEEPCLFGDCKYRKVIKRLSNTLWQTTWMWHL